MTVYLVRVYADPFDARSMVQSNVYATDEAAQWAVAYWARRGYVARVDARGAA